MSLVFPKTDITEVLKLIERQYRTVYLVPSKRNSRLMKLYSNMAALTLSGWVEDGMNKLLELSLNGLSASGQTRLLEKNKKIWGASYWHFTNRLELAYGSHGLQFIESQVGSTDLARLESILNNLKQYRGSVAHSYSVTILRDPSGILSDAGDIIPILSKFEQSARHYKSAHF